MASVQGFMKRAGSAVGAFLLGAALKAIGYDQLAMLWRRYDLEKRKRMSGL